MDEAAYVVWRFLYWNACGNMTYEDIEAAVSAGTLKPGTMPIKENDDGTEGEMD